MIESFSSTSTGVSGWEVAATVEAIGRSMVPPTLVKVPPERVIPEAFDIMSVLIVRPFGALAWGMEDDS